MYAQSRSASLLDALVQRINAMCGASPGAAQAQSDDAARDSRELADLARTDARSLRLTNDRLEALLAALARAVQACERRRQQPGAAAPAAGCELAAVLALEVLHSLHGARVPEVIALVSAGPGRWLEGGRCSVPARQ